MATKLSATPTEEGTLGITVTFYDDAGAAVAPSTLTWTLTNSAGTVVNNRDAVSVSSPSSSETITLSGNDLQILSSTDDGLRYVTFEGTYDSSTLGSGLPLKAACTFYVENLPSVT